VPRRREDRAVPSCRRRSRRSPSGPRGGICDPGGGRIRSQVGALAFHHERSWRPTDADRQQRRFDAQRDPCASGATVSWANRPRAPKGPPYRSLMFPSVEVEAAPRGTLATGGCPPRFVALLPTGRARRSARRLRRAGPAWRGRRRGPRARPLGISCDGGPAASWPSRVPDRHAVPRISSSLFRSRMRSRSARSPGSRCPLVLAIAANAAGANLRWRAAPVRAAPAPLIARPPGSAQPAAPNGARGRLVRSPPPAVGAGSRASVVPWPVAPRRPRIGHPCPLRLRDRGASGVKDHTRHHGPVRRDRLRPKAEAPREGQSRRESAEFS
jgi:hypothetical protein